ncbi:MAG: FAD:protein FMN transferase [Pseudomonadota bacterium]
MLALLLSTCARQEEPLYTQQLLTFGTLVDISIWGVDKERAMEASRQIGEELQQMHNDWHAWHDSPLTRMNTALASGATVTVPPSLLPLLQKSLTLSRQSEGLFNPAIGKLIKLWGFAQDDLPGGPPPDAAAVAGLVTQHPGMVDLTLEKDRLHSVNPAVQLDFGAIGKGYGVDLAIERLRQLGVENAIVNAGGNLRAIGRHGDRPWRIGIRNPRGPGVLASIETRGDESILTSGDYERFFEYQGKRYHHIIDPRSGWPATGVTSVTVIAADAATADAASTALFIAGPQDWREIAKHMGIKQVMLIDDQGQVTMTPEMAQRVRFEASPAPKVKVSAPI